MRVPPDDVIPTLSENKKYVDLLVEAVERSNGRQTFQTLVTELVTTKATLWVRKNSLIVTQLLIYPTGAKWLSVRIGCGNMNTLKAMIGKIEEYAKSRGYDGLESTARPGWARVGKALGYKTSHLFIEKELD